MGLCLDAGRGVPNSKPQTPNPKPANRECSPNLLVDGQFRVKIADFGLSRFRVEYTMTFCGSPKWTAPEVLSACHTHTYTHTHTESLSRTYTNIHTYTHTNTHRS